MSGEIVLGNERQFQCRGITELGDKGAFLKVVGLRMTVQRGSQRSELKGCTAYDNGICRLVARGNPKCFVAGVTSMDSYTQEKQKLSA